MWLRLCTWLAGEDRMRTWRRLTAVGQERKPRSREQARRSTDTDTQCYTHTNTSILNISCVQQRWRSVQKWGPFLSHLLPSLSSISHRGPHPLNPSRGSRECCELPSSSRQARSSNALWTVYFELNHALGDTKSFMCYDKFMSIYWIDTICKWAKVVWE